MEYRPLGRTGVQVSKLCLALWTPGSTSSTPLTCTRTASPKPSSVLR